MKKNILFTAIAAVTCMLAGCEQNVNNPQVTHAGFSVAPNRYVQFAPGNLQYTYSTDTWAFAAEQYEMLGTDNLIDDAYYQNYDVIYGGVKEGATALADKIDLFNWSSSAELKWGVPSSLLAFEAYNGDFADWGQKIDDGKTWRTLTIDEWTYLLDKRPNASVLKGIARIYLNDDGSKFSNGLILLPDNWRIPNGITFKSAFSNEKGAKEYAAYQTYTLTEWKKLESAGAAFLPASGYRSGDGCYDVQNYGTYWSSTSYDSSCAYFLLFQSNEFELEWSGDDFGYAVRLVQDLDD